MEFFTVNSNIELDPKILILLIPVFVLNVTLFIIALVSIIKSSMKRNEKIIWVIVSLCVSVIGPLVYLVYSGINRKNGDDEDE
ncbi:MAG: PLD nuclease N-terminal domain-containing protein [Ruminococcus sp.]|jgi:heme/copper-type cytochrome/quinol oxidase subunit 4|nr:PLD nuclease N-terminal domain-containing protein [Ruminococcus sp.]